MLARTAGERLADASVARRGDEKGLLRARESDGPTETRNTKPTKSISHPVAGDITGYPFDRKRRLEGSLESKSYQSAVLIVNLSIPFNGAHCSRFQPPNQC